MLRKRKVVSFGIVFLFLLTILTVQMTTPAEVRAFNSSDTTVGVIKWDGQVASSPVGVEEMRVLGPSQFSDRLPFYATKPTSDTVSFDSATQTVVDQEIAYAKDAGIDYFAYCWYSPNETDDTRNMYKPLDLHLSSTNCNDVNWSAILFTHPMYTADESWFVTKMGQSNYQKVLDGRPLVYCYNYPALVDASLITRLRNAYKAAHNGTDLYVVALDYSTTGAQSFASQIGADAISCYVTGASNGQAYSSVASNERNNWNAYKNTNLKVIPWVTTGWDARPRAIAVPDYKYCPDEQGYNSPAATPSEISFQLQSALDWNSNNTSTAEANTVLVYSWNEFSEGGTGVVCPKMGGDRSILDAFKDVLTSVPGSSIIVDNDDANFSHTTNWTRYTGQGYNDSVYCKVAGNGSEYCTFTPNLPSSGNYKVYARWSAYTNRATNSPFTIYYNGGNQTVQVNQQINGDTWVYLGTWNFASGTSGYVKLADNANGQVIADAVKFTPSSQMSFITSNTTLSTTLRNNYDDYVGMKITVGSTPMIVEELGRYYVSGNSGTHTVGIFSSSGTLLTSVNIDMSTGSPDSLGFKYATLSTPYTLAANTTYYIGSDETSSGDQWYDYDCSLGTSGSALVKSGAYRYSGVWYDYGGMGNCYGPVNVKYLYGS